METVLSTSVDHAMYREAARDPHTVENMIRRNWRGIFILMAMVADTIAAIMSGVAAYYLRLILTDAPAVSIDVLSGYMLYFWCVLIFIGLVVGVYRAAYHGILRQQYFLAGKSYLYSFLVTFASLYILEKDFPPRFTFIFFLILPVCFLVGRAFLNSFNTMVHKKWRFGIQNALIAGYEKDGKEVLNRFKGFPELGYNIKGFVTNKKSNGGLRPQISIDKLAYVIKKEKINSIFVPSTKLITNGYAEVMEICKRERVRLKILSPESDRLLRMNRVYDIVGITLYSPQRTKIEFIHKVVKRAFDVLGSTILIMLFSPIFIVTAAAIYFESGFPVIFKQNRTSVKGEKIFHFFKFRSMIKGADKMQSELMEFNESDGALFKIRKDPRLTRVGKFIRKFSIDELPQLFNVLIGDMSLVGPRPIPLPDFEKIDEGEEFWDAIRGRARLKPGMTGLWQISGRSHLGFKEMLMLDFYYIDNQSLLFDLEILFETIPVVLFGKGAY